MKPQMEELRDNIAYWTGYIFTLLWVISLVSLPILACIVLLLNLIGG